MSEIKSLFDRLINDVREERKEVQQFLREDVNKTRQDIAELWTHLEEQWEDLKERNVDLQDKAAEVGQDFRDGMNHLADELRKGYRELRGSLKRPADDEQQKPPT